MNFGTKVFFEKFLSHFCAPGARFSPKMRQGSQTSNFARSKILTLYCVEITTYFPKFWKSWANQSRYMHQKGLFGKKKCILGIFSPKSSQWTRNTTQKRVNDKVSGIGTCKFEFSSLKNHYNDIHNCISTNIRKKPQKGVFSPKRAPRAHPRVIPECR